MRAGVCNPVRAVRVLSPLAVPVRVSGEQHAAGANRES